MTITMKNYIKIIEMKKYDQMIRIIFIYITSKTTTTMTLKDIINHLSTYILSENASLETIFFIKLLLNTLKYKFKYNYQQYRINIYFYLREINLKH